MDVLGDICTRLRLKAGLYFRADIHCPFSIRLPREETCIRFHHVLDGNLHVGVPDGARESSQVSLGSGDLVLVPDGAPQVLSSSLPAPPPQDLSVLLMDHPPRDGVLRIGEQAMTARILCGYLAFDDVLLHPAFAALPPVLVLRRGDPVAGAALAMLHVEAGGLKAGSSFVLHRIVEILLLQALRENLGERPAPRFSGALRDARLARALAAIHAEPERNWDIANLSAVAGMSRSRFSEGFRAAVGQTPHAYLTFWRMTLARELLRNEPSDIADIAARCGYSSVPAFTRRFSTLFGIGPAQWRRRSM